MKIVHRIPTSSEDPIRQDLEQLGFSFKKDLEAFLIDEGNAYWPQVAKLFEQYRSFQLVYAEFTDHEVQTADHVALYGIGAHGYPQPEMILAARRQRMTIPIIASSVSVAWFRRLHSHCEANQSGESEAASCS